MKDICVIGASNALIRHGFASHLPKYFGKVGNLSLGANGSLLGCVTLLHSDVIGKYRYIVFDFNIADTYQIISGLSNQYAIISYVAFMLKLFEDSPTVPMLLILPNLTYPFARSQSWLYRAMGKIFEIPVVDMEDEFKSFAWEDLSPATDRAHLHNELQLRAAQLIYEASQNYRGPSARRVPLEIDYSLLKPGDFPPEIKRKKLGTSWRKMEIAEFGIGDMINIPADKMPAGFFFYSDAISPFIRYDVKGRQIAKSFNLIFKGFFARCIAAGTHEFGGVIDFISELPKDVEQTYAGKRFDHVPSDAKFQLAGLLLANNSPYQAGKAFYKAFESIFEQEKSLLNNIITYKSIQNGPQRLSEFLSSHWPPVSPIPADAFVRLLSAIDACDAPTPRLLLAGAGLAPDQNTEASGHAEIFQLDFNAGQSGFHAIRVNQPYNWIEIEDNSFDFIIVNDLFAGLQYFWITALEIRRILKPGGSCLMVSSASGGGNIPGYQINSAGLKSLAGFAGLQEIRSGRQGLGTSRVEWLLCGKSADAEKGDGIYEAMRAASLLAIEPRQERQIAGFDFFLSAAPPESASQNAAASGNPMGAPRYVAYAGEAGFPYILFIFRKPVFISDIRLHDAQGYKEINADLVIEAGLEIDRLEPAAINAVTTESGNENPPRIAPINKTTRYVRIRKDSGLILALEEVEFIGRTEFPNLPTRDVVVID